MGIKEFILGIKNKDLSVLKKLGKRESFFVPYSTVYLVVTGLLIILLYKMPGLLLFFLLVLISGSAYLDWTQRKKLAVLIRQNRQLQYVDQLAQALRQSMKPAEVLEFIMMNLVYELRYDRVILYTYVVQKKGFDFLRPEAASGIDLETIKDYTFRIDKRLDILPRAVIERKPFIVRRANEDYRCDQKFVALLSLKEYVVLPIIIKDKPLGVLLADRKETSFSILEEEVPVLNMFANQAGLAIDNARLYSQIEELATTDGLTNLYNHRYFQETLRAELQRMDRYEKHERVLSLIMIDVDKFKTYNDTYGHQAGDEVLIDLGQILKGTLRKVDVVARYGGEEFVIILPVTRKEQAAMLAERLRAAVEKHPFEIETQGRQVTNKVTISLGVAAYGEDGMIPEEIIAEADRQLYKAKDGGRNRVSYTMKAKEEKLPEEKIVVDSQSQISDESLKKIFQNLKKIAVVGISNKPDRPSFEVTQYWKAQGYKVFGVNPMLTEVLGESCYPNLSALPEGTDIIQIFRRSDEVYSIVQEAVELKQKPKLIWMQAGIQSDEAKKLAESHGIPTVMNICLRDQHKRLFAQ